MSEITKTNAFSLNNIKTINIEGVEYTYSIAQMGNENGISITLSEVKPDKNITFTYQALSDKIIKDIKLLLLCGNLDEMINTLKDIFNERKIEVKKKEEKYIMIIEVDILGKISKYEIELKKNEPIDEKNDILLRIKEMEKKYKEIKEEINKLKVNNKINEEEKNNIIKEIKEDINITKRIKEILKDKEIKEILFKEFKEKISNLYMKKEEKKEKDEKVENKLNKLINEKYCYKNDEKIYNENMNKIKEDINKQINEIKEIKRNMNENIKKEINQNINENKIIKQLKEHILNEKNKYEDNYIILKIEINQNDIGRDINIINQCST